MDIKSIFKKRSFKHGGAAVLITALVIAAVIMINAGIFAIANARLWYFDMTKERVFSLSDEVKEILSPVNSDVNIYFTKDESALMSGGGTNEYMKFIYQTARELEKEFSNIHVKCVDIIENPAFFEYYYNTAATNILTTSVIVESNGEFRLMSSDAFFVWDENRTYIWGYNGEAKFAAAILQVTSSDMPAICFTEGHGEKSPDDSAAFKTLCEAAGYEVRTIDLTKEEIDDDVRMIIIDDPLYDFAGIEAGELGNELDKISAFLNSYGTVMVFADFEKSKNLKNLSELLLEWGIELSPGKTVVDPANSLNIEGTELIAEYETADTLGASLYNSISSLSSMPKTIVPNAMPLKFFYDTKSVTMGRFETSTVLYSPDGASVRDGEKSETSERLPIMTITRKEGIKDNDYIYAYMIVCGSPDYVSDKYLNSASYANSDILTNTIRLTGREKIVADIDLKMLDDTALDITAAETNGWTLAFAVIIPIIIGAVGVVICRRRRKL